MRRLTRVLHCERERAILLSLCPEDASSEKRWLSRTPRPRTGAFAFLSCSRRAEEPLTDIAKTIRARFPRWRRDPYQKAAVDAALRVIFAAENAQRELGTLEEILVFFLSDVPLSLLFGQPHAQADTLARKLEVLASELRKGSKVFKDLEPYVDQFITDHNGPEESHGGVRPQAVGDSDQSAAGAG